MFDRLARAWRSLVDVPTLPTSRGTLVIFTGPLPEWMFAAYVAQAEREGRPITDVIYTALHHQALAIVRAGATTSPRGSES